MAARRRRRPLLFALLRSYWIIVTLAATVLLGALAVHLGCQHQAPPPTLQQEEVTPLIRVRILQNVTTAKLSAITGAQPATFTMVGGESQRLAFPGRTPVTVSLGQNGWKVGARDLGVGELVIEPDPVASINLEGRAYRGSYHFVARPNTSNSFDVVNHLGIDDYLKGVLPGEMHAEFHIEAYKAQAIAARTYAIYTARTSGPGHHFDLNADVRSQMYLGKSGETKKSEEAVRATAGMVVAYGPKNAPKIFKAYYSSCCGGATLTAADVFGEAPTEPFTERSAGNRCDIAAGRYHARFDWTVTASCEEITRRLRLWGQRENHPLKNMQTLRRLDIYRSNAVGRPVAFSIEDAAGKKYVISGEQLRIACNVDAPEGSRLSSSFVTPTVEGGTVRFIGHGFGHGVGMCQWCAEAQARAGVTYDKIIADAYKGSVLIQNAYK
jgi:stage II sporulation protein D